MAISVVDTFARFVDSLADGLDDHEATGTTWRAASTSRGSTSTG